MNYKKLTYGLCQLCATWWCTASDTVIGNMVATVLYLFYHITFIYVCISLFRNLHTHTHTHTHTKCTHILQQQVTLITNTKETLFLYWYDNNVPHFNLYFSKICTEKKSYIHGIFFYFLLLLLLILLPMQLHVIINYRGADKSLARPTSRCILFDGENISFDVTLVIHINSTNIPPIMIINRIHEQQNLLSL